MNQRLRNSQTKEKTKESVGISSGFSFYTIKASKSPEDVQGLTLGQIVSIDDCVSSLFGDTKMFFKHQWIEEDIDLKPEWAKSYYSNCYCNSPLV